MNVTSDPSQALAIRWFKKAENDLLNVENNLAAERYASDTVCFHCQQVAEKYLKGFLAWHQIPFAKIHDLLELLKQVRQIAFAAAINSPCTIGPLFGSSPLSSGI